jgi:hypothetical protein
MSISPEVKALPAGQCGECPYCSNLVATLEERARRPHEWTRRLKGLEADVTSGAFQRDLRAWCVQLDGRFTEWEVAEMSNALGCSVVCQDLLLVLPEAYSRGRTARGEWVNPRLMFKLSALTLRMKAALLDVLEWLWLDGRPSGLSVLESCDHCGLQLADGLDE